MTMRNDKLVDDPKQLASNLRVLFEDTFVNLELGEMKETSKKLNTVSGYKKYVDYFNHISKLISTQLSHISKSKSDMTAKLHYFIDVMNACQNEKNYPAFMAIYTAISKFITQENLSSVYQKKWNSAKDCYKSVSISGVQKESSSSYNYIILPHLGGYNHLLDTLKEKTHLEVSDKNKLTEENKSDPKSKITKEGIINDLKKLQQKVIQPSKEKLEAAQQAIGSTLIVDPLQERLDNINRISALLTLDNYQQALIKSYIIRCANYGSDHATSKVLADYIACTVDLDREKSNTEKKGDTDKLLAYIGREFPETTYRVWVELCSMQSFSDTKTNQDKFVNCLRLLQQLGRKECGYMLTGKSDFTVDDLVDSLKLAKNEPEVVREVLIKAYQSVEKENQSENKSESPSITVKK